MSFDFYALPKKKRELLIEEFIDSIALLNNRTEADKFCRDLFTQREMVILSLRIKIALLLLKNRSKEQVRRDLKVSNDKILGVQKSLSRGGQGYDLIIKRLIKQGLREIKEKGYDSRMPPWTFIGLMQRFGPLS